VTLRRVAVRTTVDAAEPLRARLLDLVPGGFEERADGADVELAAYVPERDVDALLRAFPGATTGAVDEGWEDAWRAFHRPVVVAGLWLGPPWEQPPDPSRSVVIDPGRAFGTGAHPTTRLCVELLAATTSRGALLDVGCGSGVLAIAGVRLGFAPVLGIDVDPVAVETTLANAAANGVALEAAVLDAVAESLPPANVAVANVLLRPVEVVLGRLDSREAITSGYLAGERPAHGGWRHVETLELDGWAADRFRRPVGGER
jgi:ribosomal protein L11 methyltransferase